MMKITAIFLCCVLVLSVTRAANTKGEIPNHTESTGSSSSSPVTKETTVPPAPTTIITSSTSPAPATTTTTTSPTTPTSAPDTTTASTTISPDTTSTTPSTSTTPVPPPKPSDGKWVVNGLNKTCIVARMDMELTVEVANVTSKTRALYKIEVPANQTSASGSCKEDEQIMKLSWKSSGIGNNSIILHFMNYSTKYDLHHIDVELTPEELNKTITDVLKLSHTKPHFNITIGSSYRCLKLQEFALKTESDNQTTGYLKVSNLQFQAFRNDATHKFGMAEDCAFDTSDIVPIAVGCVLAILVVIVLVAYLISRRRSQARGYLSM